MVPMPHACTCPDCAAHLCACTERARWAMGGGGGGGGEETSGHFCPASWEGLWEPSRGLGQAGHHGRPPTTCLSTQQLPVFFIPRHACFSWAFSEAFPGLGPGCGRGSSGLAVPPSSSRLPLPSWLGPPTPCIPGSRGNPGYEFQPQGPGSCPDPQGPRCPIVLFPWPVPLLPGTTQPHLPRASPPPPSKPRLCEDGTCLVHLLCLVPAHV